MNDSKKKKNLVDSFLFNKAKKEVDKAFKKEQHRNGVGTAKEHCQNISGTLLEQKRNNIGTEGECHNSVPITSLEQHRNSKGTPLKRNSIGTTSIRLPKQQLKIYKWFLSVGEEGLFNKASIMKDTGIAYMTIRKALWKFEKLELISMKYDKSLKEFEYTINLNIKIIEPKRNNIGTRQEQYENNNIISSSRNNNILTTTLNTERNSIGTPKEQYSFEVKKIIVEHCELGYWRQKGLQAEQLIHWLEVTGCSLESVILYLSYCKFEMVNNGLEKSKPIKNVFNWFFRILEKTGHYPMPEGYKSQKEKQLEQEQQLVEQKKKEAKQVENLYRQKVEAEQTRLFFEMMNDPERELYKKCFDSLNSFQKGLKRHSKVFEMGMRDAFDKFEE